MTTTLEKQLEIEARRRAVAANLMGGLTYREIAKALDVSPATISRDVKAIFKEWKQQYTTDANRYALMHMRRLDVLLNGIWGNAQNGEYAAIDRAINIMERQAKLLGIDQPFNINVESGEDTGTLQLTLTSGSLKALENLGVSVENAGKIIQYLRQLCGKIISRTSTNAAKA